MAVSTISSQEDHWSIGSSKNYIVDLELGFILMSFSDSMFHAVCLFNLVV